jgi:flap endonuclease-1
MKKLFKKITIFNGKMGIKGIKNLIKKHAPSAFEPVNLNLLRGKTLCVDSSIFLYKFRYTYTTENFHILGFFNLINKYSSYDIKLIFVFDGCPPEAKFRILHERRKKKEKLKERLDNFVHPEFIDSDSEEPDLNQQALIQRLEKSTRTVNRQHSTDLMELLNSIGIPFFACPTEAEKGCVFLQKHGYADHILTEDTDSLTFGGSSIIFGNLICSLKTVLREMELSMEQFVDLCILCGCDYTTKIRGIGPVNALKLIKKHGLIDNFPEIPAPDFNYLLARKLFKVDEYYQIEFNYQKDKLVFVQICGKWGVDPFAFKFNFSNFKEF